MIDASEYLREPCTAGYDLGIHAFAKINLGLEVGGLRPDGYHEISTVFQTVNFADSLLARPRRRGIRLHVGLRGPARNRGLPILTGEDNLVHRAAALAQARMGVTEGAEILLIKRVPAGSGLGGGSSDAAAALRLVARLWNRRRPLREMQEWAAELGSDCAFFVRGGRARARGRGEILRRVASVPNRRVLLVVPRVGISTNEAYRLFDLSKSLTGGRRNHNLASPRRSAPVGRSARSLMPNHLEEVVARQYSDVGRAKRLLELRGVAAIGMSGSGSAVFGVLSPGVDSRGLVPKQQRSLEVVLARFNRVGSQWYC